MLILLGKRALRATCLSVLLVLASTVVSAQERVTLRVGYVGFPPLQYQADNGEPAGTMIDLTRTVAEEAGYELEFTYLPTSRAYYYLRFGTIDLLPGLSMTPELSGSVFESRFSPMAIQLSAWSLGDTPAITDFKHFEGHIVILIAGFTYGGLRRYLEASPAIKTTQAPNHVTALEMLRRKRGDYVLDYRQPIQQVLQTHPMAGLNESEVQTRYGALLFSRQHPDAQRFRDNFDDAYLRLAERGVLPGPIIKRASYRLPGYPLAY